MTDDSEWWTQHVLILLGDPSLAPWTLDPLPLQIEAPADYGPGYQTLTVRVLAGGSPRASVKVVLLKEGDFLLTAATIAAGEAIFAFIPRGPGNLLVGASAPDCTLAVAVIARALRQKNESKMQNKTKRERNKLSSKTPAKMEFFEEHHMREAVLIDADNAQPSSSKDCWRRWPASEPQRAGPFTETGHPPPIPGKKCSHTPSSPSAVR
jgi:hypothetical protein